MPTLASVVPLVGDDGRIVGSLGFVMDLSAYKRVEQHLAEANSMLERAQELAHVGSCRWVEGEETIAWSAQMYRIFAVAPETRIDWVAFVSRVHPDDRAAFEGLL